MCSGAAGHRSLITATTASSLRLLVKIAYEDNRQAIDDLVAAQLGG